MTAAQRSGTLHIGSRLGRFVAAAGALVLALTSAPAQAPKFSHRAALRKPGAQCTDCHASTAASAKSSGKRNLRFNHKLHLAMGNVAPVIAAAIDSGKYLSPPDDIRRHLNTKNPCEACHRGLEQAVQVTKANFPQMADCLVCHSNIDLPFSCEKCHVNTAVLKPASHTPDYLDLHSSKKITFDKTTCRVCHGTGFHCMGCH
jgi:hypothetical protein